jgi:2-polyprenyl-3-methyl-5-hydroxy-6-metoxy-1,4-benzoquinol methylase
MMRTTPLDLCAVCGSNTTLRYTGLADHVFGASGTWSVHQCPTCGLYQLNPRPVSEDLHLAYSSYYTHGSTPQPSTALNAVRGVFERSVLRFELNYRQVPASRLFYLLSGLHPDTRAFFASKGMFLNCPAPGRNSLLDVGCGNGEHMATMQQLGWAVTGVDFDAKAVAAAQSRGLNVTVGSIDAPEIAESGYDAIHCAHVIEHVDNPLQFLRMAHQRLKVAGKLVIRTPNGMSWGHKRYQEDWRGLEPPRHLQVFSRKNMALLLKQTGFTDVQIRTNLGGSRYVYNMSMRIAELRRGRSPASDSTARNRWAKALVQTLINRLRCLTDNDAGEELLVIASREG